MEGWPRLRPPLTLVDVVAAKVGAIGVVSEEAAQEAGEVVALTQGQVGTQHMLVRQPQVEVIAEGVYMHQVPDLVTFLSEQHGELRGKMG